MSAKQKIDVYAELTHGTDGPVTTFVIIHRAIELTIRYPDLKEDIKETLYNILQEDF